jgi:sigma-E factor negative regulatory protein RseA
MNDQEQTSQLSALFDGELPPQQAEMVIRRALKDPQLRVSWERYALIGACLRGEPVGQAGTHASLADRLRVRLASEAEYGTEAAVTAPQPASRSRPPMFARLAQGGAIAAGVALVSVFLVRQMAPLDEAGALVVQDATAPVATGTVVAATQPASNRSSIAPDTAPRSYTTPGENSPASTRLIDQPLAHYVVAHSELAASSFGFSYDLTQGATEMTEAEIKARR